MKHVLARAAMVLVPAAAVCALAVPASASARPHVTPTTAPRLVTVEALTLLNNRGDSGGGGNTWATDTIIRALVIHQTGGTPGAYTFTATVSDSGSFVTIPHVLSPNQFFAGTTIAAKVNGTMAGHASYTFTASQLPRENLVPAQESGTPSSGPRTTSSWYEQAYPAGTTFGGAGIGNDWGWNYTGPACSIHVPGGVVTTHERWADTALNGDGQLAADGNITGVCPAL